LLNVHSERWGKKRFTNFEKEKNNLEITPYTKARGASQGY